MTFDEAMVLTRTISSHTCFEDDECRAYFDILMSLPKHSPIVEIGLEYGRSSSIALQVAKERQLQYSGIDSNVRPEWESMAASVGQYYLRRMNSCDVSINELQGYPGIACILIDGDHEEASVLDDCERFLPHVLSGGYALLHDYDRWSLPGVRMAAARYFTNNPDWEQLPTVVTLGIWGRR